MKTRQRIAIIGSGISGLSAAWLLHESHDIVLYEKNAVAGGHARTLTIDYDGTAIDVDTGFIVFNDRNYPNLTGLFTALDVPFHNSDMSFAASIEEGAFEYSSRSLGGIFPTFASLFDARRYKIMRDYLRFSKFAKALLKTDSRITLGELITQSRVSDIFARSFILPMGAAIWSCPVAQMFDYPAATFARFFENHGLLDYNGQPQWFTVTGGSMRYVEKITAALGSRIRLNASVSRVERTESGANVIEANGHVEQYDHVIFACHAPQAHALFSNPTAEESAILGRFRTQPNEVYLHSDIRLMPRLKKCWASWVYLTKQREDKSPALAVTYWMNLLQNIDYTKPLFVTLNPPEPPQSSLVFNHHQFAHPIFDQKAVDAQAQLPSINGKHHISWCGAWTRYGFHEDGIHSAVGVVRALGGQTPWK